METNDSVDNRLLRECLYFWEEYKYRHNHIWQLIFRFTAAVVLISVIPYLEPNVAGILGYGILITPVLAFLLVVYVLLVLRNELDLFTTIKRAYRQRQNELLYGSSHDLDKPSTFDKQVVWYFRILGLLAFINGLIVGLVFVPGLSEYFVCSCC